MQVEQNAKKDVNICWQISYILLTSVTKCHSLRQVYKSLKFFWKKVKKVWIKSRKKNSNNNRDFNQYASWKWLPQIKLLGSMKNDKQMS